MPRRTGYRLAGYGEMMTDGPRMAAYREALRQAVGPDSVVLDLGAGPGIFSLLACRLGARHVHAVEPDESIQMARTLAAANGLEGRITFHRKLSTEVELPEPAQVVVSDLRSVLPLFEHHIPAVVDARERLLAPEGILIPRADEIHGALATSPELYRRYAEPWITNDFGLDLSPGHREVVNQWRRVHAGAGALLTEPRLWARLTYGRVREPDVASTLSWTLEAPGTGHGLLVWFDADLGERAGFSNAPGKEDLIYGQAFFPWQEPLALEAGDQVAVELRADLVGDDYVWRWHTRVEGAGGGLRADFRQSTFHGDALAAGRLRKRASEFVPVLKEESQVDRLILSLMDGERTLEAIAREVARHYPRRFAGWEEAMDPVGRMAETHAR